MYTDRELINEVAKIAADLGVGSLLLKAQTGDPVWDIVTVQAERLSAVVDLLRAQRSMSN